MPRIDIEFARNWLANEMKEYDTPPSYDWFGCESDDALEADIIETAKFEEYTPEDLTSKHILQTVLALMLYG